MENEKHYGDAEEKNPPKPKDKKGSTSSDAPNGNDSGESTVQEGEEIVNQEEQNTIVNDDGAEEFLDNTNNVTIVKDDNRHTQIWLRQTDEDEDDDDSDEDDDDDDDGVEIGDDPAETKKKIPVM